MYTRTTHLHSCARVRARAILSLSMRNEGMKPFRMFVCTVYTCTCTYMIHLVVYTNIALVFLRHVLKAVLASRQNGPSIFGAKSTNTLGTAMPYLRSYISGRGSR